MSAHPNIRQQLDTRRKLLSERHERIGRDLARQNEALVADSDDQAIQRANDDALQAIDAAALQEIAAIDAALERLDQGQYGVCVRCEGTIEAGRLAAVPHAITCVRCSSN